MCGAYDGIGTDRGAGEKIHVLNPDNQNTEAKQIIDIIEKKILEKISPKAYIIAMCVEGKQLSSEELAEKISNVTLSGKSEIVFIIGSSFGLSNGIKNIADYKLSISKLTFPHQLLRVILHETIYRSLSIINGTKYHK